jgi:hypothetical protein
MEAMTKQILTDLDDDGNISIFAKGSQFLFTCSEGHWWTVSASSVGRHEPEVRGNTGGSGRTTVSGGGEFDEGAPGGFDEGGSIYSEDRYSSESSAALRAIKDEFGDAPLRAMNIELTDE